MPSPSGSRECGVCWWVYDPALGDAIWQIPPGTAFEDLPADWRCPRCDSARERFLRPAPRLVPAPVEARVVELVAAFEDILESRMRGLPILNPRLQVQALAFGLVEAGLLGALITPWSINAILFPNGEVGASTQGISRTLPGGSFEFFTQRLKGRTPFEQCSLLSPVADLADQAAAIAVASSALQRMRTAPSTAAPIRSRRELFSWISRRGEP